MSGAANSAPQTSWLDVRDRRGREKGMRKGKWRGRKVGAERKKGGGRKGEGDKGKRKGERRERKGMGGGKGNGGILCSCDYSLGKAMRKHMQTDGNRKNTAPVT